MGLSVFEQSGPLSMAAEHCSLSCFIEAPFHRGNLAATACCIHCMVHAQLLTSPPDVHKPLGVTVRRHEPDRFTC